MKMRNTLRWVCGNCLGREKDEREREGAEENEGGEKGESFLWRRMWGSDDLSLEFIAILAQMSDLNEGGEKKREGTRMNIQHVFNFPCHVIIIFSLVPTDTHQNIHFNNIFSF